MSYSIHRATMESCLARAHRALCSAKEAADRLGDDGSWLDIQQIEVEVVRVAERSLKDKASRRPMIAGQLEIDS